MGKTESLREVASNRGRMFGIARKLLRGLEEDVVDDILQSVAMALIRRSQSRGDSVGADEMCVRVIYAAKDARRRQLQRVVHVHSAIKWRPIVVAGSLAETIPDYRKRPDVAAMDRVDALSALSRLTDRELEMVIHYFVEDMSMSEIGEKHGLSKMRISQILAAARGKMRKAASERR